ncbi:MAG: hypothetical protein J1E00_02865 [Oscillospiraceae bacterium]|nr:hypothetical protein [Oscillospiraceae bacterium]
MPANGKPFYRSRPFLAVVLLLCLAMVIGLCIGVVQLLLKQGQEVALSVETSGDKFTESVTITVRNVLGMDILIDEQARSCAMLQYRDGKEWKDISEIRFVQEDAIALSAKYGGMYAHLAPGGELHYELSGEQLERLPGGEYRIAIRYISENEYIDYLYARAREIEASLDEAENSSEPEVSAPEDGDSLPAEVTTPSESAENTEEDASAPEESLDAGDKEVPSPETQLLYAEFIIISKSDSNAD